MPPLVEGPESEISGLTSSSISTNSGDTLRSATEIERVLDLDLALGATLFLFEGVVEGSIVGGGVGALSENSFSYHQFMTRSGLTFKRTTSVLVVERRK